MDEIHEDNVLFLDIETAPMAPDFINISEQFKTFWEKKSVYFRKQDETAADVWPRAGIYAEFGKIICVSAAMFYTKEGRRHLRVKSFCDNDEIIVLIGFSNFLERLQQTHPDLMLCAHNGREFDFPFIARRMLVNDIKLPTVLDIAGRKPWEVKFLDTMELWKFGDHKHYTSLDLLAALFNIPTPKDDIDGSKVWQVYWQDKDLPRIQVYCQKDVVTIAQLLLRYKGKEIVPRECVEFVDS